MKTNRKNQKAKYETGIEQLIERWGRVISSTSTPSPPPPTGDGDQKDSNEYQE
jgi:hypothetical protein